MVSAVRRLILASSRIFKFSIFWPVFPLPTVDQLTKSSLQGGAIEALKLANQQVCNDVNLELQGKIIVGSIATIQHNTSATSLFYIRDN
jgi:hypothetical protein